MAQAAQEKQDTLATFSRHPQQNDINQSKDTKQPEGSAQRKHEKMTTRRFLCASGSRDAPSAGAEVAGGRAAPTQDRVHKSGKNARIRQGFAVACINLTQGRRDVGRSGVHNEKPAGTDRWLTCCQFVCTLWACFFCAAWFGCFFSLLLCPLVA